MLSDTVRRVANRLLLIIVRLLARLGVSPNVLTVLGFAATAGVGVLLAMGYMQLGGVLIVGVGIFDALDGSLARFAGKPTNFGAFLDSTLDRFSEAALFGGLLFFYLQRGAAQEVLLVYATVIGSLMVSYTRARAEGLGLECRVGLFTRLERIAVLALGLVLNQMLLALLVLAIFTNITALQRIVHVWRLTRERDPAAEFTPSEAEGLRAGRTIPESRYPYPPALVAAITWSVLTGRRRSFAADSARLLAGVKPVPRIENAHLIPAEGSFMVTANHYGRPGFDVWWCAILVSHAIAERRVNESCDIHWLMASEWRVQGLKNLVEQPLTRFLFARLARSYGFISTPPMPPDPGRAAQGMHSVRQALRIAHPSDGERAGLIGVFPEGQDTPHSALMQPLHGVGTFLIMLTRNGLPILPVGLHERDGALVAAFGTPFTLNVPPGLSREERDREACQQVMVAVGKLLPPELWGDYHQEVAEALKEE